MSAFAALGGHDGDQAQITKKAREQEQKAKEAEEAEAARARAAFAATMERVGSQGKMSNWGDDSDEDVRCHTALPLPGRVPSRPSLLPRRLPPAAAAPQA
jgi:hypothetical protein